MSLARRIADRSTGAVAGILLGVGLLVGGGLYFEGLRSVDAALLAAAQARATAGPEATGYEAEHVHFPVQTAFVPKDREPFRGEHPRFETDGALRRLWLPVELHGPVEDEETHRMVVAEATAPTAGRLVGPFAAIYVVVAALALLGTRAVLRAVAVEGLAPLEQARLVATRAVGEGQGARVPVDGPPEVAELLRAIDALLERRDQAFATQARFTAHAAHELRTPLTALRGELEVALRRPREPGQWEEVARGLLTDVARLSQLVEGLLTLARVDAGQSEAGRELVTPDALLRAVLQVEGPHLSEAGCALTVELHDDRPVRVQRPLAQAALGNLLRNAADHAPGRPVSLTVEAVGPRVRFTVRDGGAGVPEAERATVFDRFVRGSTSRGLGLGLPLAREIARRHGGDCTLGAGSAICWELPAAG